MNVMGGIPTSAPSEPEAAATAPLLGLAAACRRAWARECFQSPSVAGARRTNRGSRLFSKSVDNCSSRARVLQQE